MNVTTYAQLSKNNLLNNLNIFKTLAKNSQIIAMVKANAYGHGLRSVALRLEAWVEAFGVARIEEAIALRNAGIKKEILLMEGVFQKEELFSCKNLNFQVVIHNQEQTDWLFENNLASDIKTWLKVDTGMSRLGFSLNEAENIYSKINPYGIMSHFACADEKEHPLNQKQIDDFTLFCKDKKALKSINNSAGAINFPECNFDFIRPGLGLYGASPIKNKSAQELGLKPVMTLCAQIIAIKSLKKGQSIGYGARYICEQDMKIGVIAIGYGDGYPRTAQDQTPVLYNETICPLVGKVSMDMATIDLTNIQNAKIGDFAVLWGEGLPIDLVSIHTQNSPYDLFCSVQNRVKFIWQ